MTSNRLDDPLRRMFQGLVEDAFCAHVGLCCPELTDYLADMLAEFVHVDRLYALRDAAGRPIDQVADMLALLEFANNAARSGSDLVVHRHIGDFTLFWSGVYPEYLQRSRGLAFKDRLIDYVRQGKRSYAIASQLAAEKASPPPALLSRLSAEFESCCHGLGLVRRGWEQAEPEQSGLARRLLY